MSKDEYLEFITHQPYDAEYLRGLALWSTPKKDKAELKDL